MVNVFIDMDTRWFVEVFQGAQYPGSKAAIGREGSKKN